MAFEITRDGVQVETYEEIFQSLVDGYKEIYGDDINVSQESPDGQRIGIEAKIRLDIQSFIAEMQNQNDPDFATGINQKRLLKYSSMFLRAATRSQVTIDITTDRNLTLTDDYTIKDELEQRWVISDETAVLTGTTQVTFFAEDFGAIEADPNTITQPVTIILGVTAINNAAAATPGKVEETELEARLRRNASTENPAYSTVGSLFARLANLANVVDVVVFENDTNNYDAEKDLNSHNIWVVIDGGELDSIAELIIKNKTTGAPMKGSITHNFVENVERPDGTTYPITHIVKWDNPVDKDLYINLTATRRNSSSPVNLDLIKAELAKKIFRITEITEAAKLYQFAYNAGTNFILSDLEISDDNVLFTDGSISPGYDGRFNIDVANINVTEVIP